MSKRIFEVECISEGVCCVTYLRSAAEALTAARNLTKTHDMRGFDVMIVRPVRRGWNADAGLSWDVRLTVERYGERWQWQGARWEANQ